MSVSPRSGPQKPTADLHESSHPDSQDPVSINLNPPPIDGLLWAGSGDSLQSAPYGERSGLHLSIMKTASEITTRSLTHERGSVGTKQLIRLRNRRFVKVEHSWPCHRGDDTGWVYMWKSWQSLWKITTQMDFVMSMKRQNTPTLSPSWTHIKKSFRLRNAWSENKEVAYKPMTKPMKRYWIKKCIYEEN